MLFLFVSCILKTQCLKGSHSILKRLLVEFPQIFFFAEFSNTIRNWKYSYLLVCSNIYVFAKSELSMSRLYNVQMCLLTKTSSAGWVYTRGCLGHWSVGWDSSLTHWPIWNLNENFDESFWKHIWRLMTEMSLVKLPLNEYHWAIDDKSTLV